MTNNPPAGDPTPPGAAAETGTSPGTGTAPGAGTASHPDTAPAASADSGAAGEPGTPSGPGAAGEPGTASGPGAAGEPPPRFGPPPPPYGPPSGPGWAGRYGLVRPLHGRYVAGVCAAIARVTNTDPVLWRVLVAVLTLFGGIGLVLYLVGWLLMPAEGDTAPPLEAMLGRGQSSTSPLNVILITILATLVFVFVISDGFRVAVLGVVAVIAALVLFGRNANDRPGFRVGGPAGRWPGAAGPGTPAPGVPAPGPVYDAPAPGTAPPGVPTSGSEAWGAARYPSVSAPLPASAATSGAPASGTVAEGLATGGTVAEGAAPGQPPPPGGYRPPFAPHGPYASFPPPPVAVRRPPKPPKPPRQPSRLGRFVLSLVCVALGALAVTDLAVGEIPVSAYFAAALAVVGLGLLVGAWLGRARWLIAVGLALSVTLGIASVAENDRVRDLSAEPMVWQPTSVAEIDPSYQLNMGQATLDLRDVDFTAAAQPVTIDLSVDYGNLRILLPRNVDVDVTANVDFGNADVLGEHWDGIRTSQHTHDVGRDGVGGGQLVLTANVKAGNLEVRR